MWLWNRGSSRISQNIMGLMLLELQLVLVKLKEQRTYSSGLNCNFQVMDALDLKFEDGSFDAIWSVEAGAHMNDKTKFADEMLRTLRPGGYLALADWNSRDLREFPPSFFEKIVLKQLLEQWVHPILLALTNSKFLELIKIVQEKLFLKLEFYTNPHGTTL